MRFSLLPVVLLASAALAAPVPQGQKEIEPAGEHIVARAFIAPKVIPKVGPKVTPPKGGGGPKSPGGGGDRTPDSSSPPPRLGTGDKTPDSPTTGDKDPPVRLATDKTEASTPAGDKEGPVRLGQDPDKNKKKEMTPEERARLDQLQAADSVVQVTSGGVMGIGMMNQPTQ